MNITKFLKKKFKFDRIPIAFYISVPQTSSFRSYSKEERSSSSTKTQKVQNSKNGDQNGASGSGGGGGKRARTIFTAEQLVNNF
jgi:hypothetical protein